MALMQLKAPRGLLSAFNVCRVGQWFRRTQGAVTSEQLGQA